MNRFWVIGDSKRVLFPEKSVFILLLSYFCTLFSKNWLFATRPPFLNRRLLINGPFSRIVTFHMINVKRVVLWLLFRPYGCILHPRFIIRRQSHTGFFYCKGGSSSICEKIQWQRRKSFNGAVPLEWQWFENDIWPFFFYYYVLQLYRITRSTFECGNPTLNGGHFKNSAWPIWKARLLQKRDLIYSFDCYFYLHFENTLLEIWKKKSCFCKKQMELLFCHNLAFLKVL